MPPAPKSNQKIGSFERFMAQPPTSERRTGTEATIAAATPLATIARSAIGRRDADGSVFGMILNQV